MVRPRTTTWPSKDLVRPSTSIAISDDGGRLTEDGGRRSEVGGQVSEDGGAGGGAADSISRPVPVSDCVLAIISWPPSQARWKRADEEGRKAGFLNRHLPSVLRHLASVV